MPYLQEFYQITTDDECITVHIKKDVFGNLELTLEDTDGAVGQWEIPEELVSKFVYAINRITNQ